MVAVRSDRLWVGTCKVHIRLVLLLHVNTRLDRRQLLVTGHISCTASHRQRVHRYHAPQLQLGCVLCGHDTGCQLLGNDCRPSWT